MFEKLLQKILKDVIGEFTQQIDTNNLSVGIWSGQIQINKVKLNKNLFKKFNIPLNVVFSYINELKIKIPWKSFFSSPLIISIDSVWALCTIDSGQIPLQQQKHALINSLKLMIANLGKKIIQKLKTQQDKESGYFDNILLKMFDNLYLNIKNIHFRFENLDRKFSFGLVIDAIDIHAVDEKNKQIFIDRNKLKENQKTIRRKFSLQKLRFYWQPSENFFLVQKQLKEKQQFYKNSLKSYQSKQLSLIYILYLDLQGLIIQNQNEKQPFYDVQVTQQKIELKLKKQVIEQFIYFAKSLQQIIKKINALKINTTQCTKKTYLFLKDFCQNYVSDKDSKLSQKQKDERLLQNFKVNHQEIMELINLNHEKLVSTVQNIILNEVGQDKVLKSLDLKQFDLKKMIPNENKGNQKAVNSKIKLTFVLPKALVYLFSSENRPLLEINLSNTGIFYVIQNDQTKIDLKVRSISIVGQENSQIFRMNKKDKQKESLHFSQIYQGKKTLIELQTSTINVLYDPKIIFSIVSFFSFTSIDSKMKNQALDKLQKIESNVTSQIKNSQQKVILKILVDGLSTTFLHPIHQLMIDTGPIRLKNQEKKQNYTFQTENIKMKMLKNSNQNKEIQIIKPFSLILSYEIQKNLTQIQIPELKLSIDRQIYLFLKDFSKIFSGEGKKEMLTKADIVGQIFIKQNRWKKTLSMIHLGKIYLWDEDETYPKLKLRIRKAKQMSKGKLNYIILGDKKNEIQIAFKTQKEYNSWKSQIENVVEFTRKSERNSSRMSSVIENRTKNTDSESSTVFRVNKIIIQLKENKQKMFDFFLQYFQYKDESKRISQYQNVCKNFQSVSLQSLKIDFENNQVFIANNNINQNFMNCIISENQEQHDSVSQVQLEIDSFNFDFNPLFFIKINSFLRQENGQNKALYILKSQQTLDKQDEEKVLSRLIIELKSSKINFINKKTNNLFAFISFQSLNLQVITKYYQFSIEGNTKKFCLGDLTGYPDTIYEKNQQVQGKIIPMHILSSEDELINSIDFSYFAVSEGSSRYNQKKKEALRLNFNNFRLNFVYQVFFRVFDYIFVQLIGSITSPEFFEQFHPPKEVSKLQVKDKIDFKKFTKKKDEIMRSKALTKMDKQQLQNYLIHGVLFYLQLKFTNSTINLVSENISSGLQFNIKSIQLQNDFNFDAIEANSIKCQLLSQIHRIQMSDIFISVVDRQYKTIVNTEPLSLKINIQMFNKDLEYHYLYGQNQAFTSHMNIFVDVQPCKLSFQSENIFLIKKMLIYNFLHDDGLDFIMIYDYMDLIPQMKINLKLIFDALTFQLIYQNEKIIVDAGNMNFLLDDTLKISQIHAQCQYFVVGYAQNNEYQQVLTSRKNFGKFQPRKTSFRNFITSYQVQKQNNQSILLFQLKSNKQNGNQDCFISIEQVMVIFNEKLLLMLKKISVNDQLIIPKERIFKDKIQEKHELQQSITKTKFVMNFNRILLCCKFPHSKEMMLALLFTCHLKKKQEDFDVSFPHLQSFLTNEQQISGQNIDLIRKRTLLKPTQIKYTQDQNEIKLFVDRIFLKISISDIQEISKLYREMISKISKLTENEKTSSLDKSSIKSFSNQSLNYYSKSKILIQVKQKDTVKTKIFQFSTVQMMIINDIQQNLIPLIYGNLNFQYEEISSTLKMQFKMDFFNIRNSYWQPLVQNTQLLIKFQPLFHIKMEEAIDFSQQIPTRQNKKQFRQFININLSTNFIQNLYKTLTNKEINFTRLYNPQEQIGIDQINSWVIVNQLGENITCRSVNKKDEVYIPLGESAKVAFLSNVRQSFNPNKKPEQKQIFVPINVIVGEKLQFKQLNANQLGLRKVFFIYQENRFSLLKNLVVDISKNVRYLTLSSPLQIQNSTNLSIQFFASSQNRYFTIPSQSTRPMPFNLTADQIVVKGISQTQQRQPSVFSLTHSVYVKQENEEVQQQNLLQLQNQKAIHFNFMSLKVKTRIQRMKKIYSFQPLYLLKNYLPQQMTIVLIDKDEQSMINQYLVEGTNTSQDSLKVGLHPIYHQINDASVSFFLEGYQWTNFESFSGKRKISIKDFSQRKLQMRIYRENQHSKTSQIIFYYPLLLKNKTLSSIKVHTPKQKKSLTKQLQKNKSQILFSRQIILQVNGGFSEQLFLRNHVEFFVFHKVLNNLRAFSKYFVYKNLDKINEDIAITEFKIFNKYLIKNDTNCDMILRPVSGKIGEIQKIKKGEITDLLFFQVESQISISSMFQLCPQDSNYEWSRPLNLLITKQSPFFIRSRFQFNKLKHYFLDVKKTIESCLQIQITQILKDEQIPYFLVNKTEDKQIFLKNTLQKIQPGQSTFFNWEDPFENSSWVYLQIKQSKNVNKVAKLYTLDLSTKQTSILINSRSFALNVEVEIIIEPTRKKIIFKDEQKKDLSQKGDEQFVQASIQLPLRISLINNSITPVVHVVDISFNLKLQKIFKGESLSVIKLDLSSIQIDNQVNHNPFFPVILSTDLSLIYQKGKNQTLQIQMKSINLKVQEDFFKSVVQLKTFFQNLLSYQSLTSEKKLQNSGNKSQFFISKLILPKIIIYLQVQTKSFSIETTVNLQRPQTCSFPWKQFPYPIKKIILNIISHLSISPWAFVSSFKKGIQILLTEQSTGRAFQGFFGTVLGAISNSLGGVLGFIVGYDVERVDNLIDGIDQGVTILFRELKEIPEFETNSCSIGSLLQGTGKTLVNILLKPIKGVLRMTLKISQGIKKTAQFSFDQQTYVKTRKPIVFYNRQQYFLTYNREQSKNLQRFKDITGNKLQFFYLVKFFPIPLYLDKMDLLLIIGTQHIIVLNLTKKTVLWLVQIPKIVKIQIVEIRKLRIIAIEDKKDQKLQLNSFYGVTIQRKKSADKQKFSESKNLNSKRQLFETQYEVWMMNENQATEVVQTYMKVKKSSKIFV